MTKPPPLPPRKPTPPRLHVPELDIFGGDELPTERQGRAYYDRLLLRYAWEMAPEDRVTLMRNAEQWAARNRKT
jgi:hypothetical protein